MKKKYPRIETRKIVELAPNEKNPRKISSEQLARLQKSLEQLGNLSPITFNVRTRRVVAGHQRLKCLAQMGRTETECWCVDLPEEKEATALLALNNHAGEWDESSLALMLDELDDKSLSGFPEGTFSELAKPTLKKVSIKKVPTMAWALVGISIEKFSIVQRLLDQMPKDSHIQTTVNNGLSTK